MTTVSVEFPTDGGFLRRECPNCSRQFKWLHGDANTESRGSSPYCPYCGRAADADRWWTPAQLDFAKKTVAHKAVDPELAKIEQALKNFGKGGGLLKVKMTGSPLRFPAPPPLHEPSDMQVVAPPCHPSEPIKIHDQWPDVAHCCVCGTQFQPLGMGSQWPLSSGATAPDINGDIMQDRLKELERHRYTLLRKVYEATNGDMRTGVEFIELAKEANISEEDADLAEQYLKAEGLLKGMGQQYVCITHQGIREMEASLREPNKPTTHFLPTTIMNFNAPVGAVQSGANSVAHVTQNVTTNSEVRVLLQQLHQHIPQAPPEQREEATEIVKALEEEAVAEKPARGKLRAFLERLKSILESPAMPVLVELGSKLLGS